MDFLSQIFTPGEFLPHSICLLARPGLVWLHAVSDSVTALAYYSIPLALSWFAWKRTDLPFKRVFVLFAAFILACGTTHVMGVVTLWVPEYGWDGMVKAVTAALSVMTAIILWPMMPQALALPSPAQLARVNRELEREVVVRREAEAEIGRKNEELQTLLARVSELDQLRSDFFANVSHELRTPLALILGPCEEMLAEPEGLDPRRRENLAVIRRNASTLLRHVDDLLDIARLDAGQLPMHYVDGDLAALLRQAAGHFEALARQRGIDYRIEAPDTLPAQFDPAHIERVLLNLLGNACKFVPDGGRIACRLARRGERAVLTIDDNGPGVPSELREAIFERFRQVEGGSTRRFGGTGLGLSIVRELVGLHHGRITAGEAPEGGARFELELPLAAPGETPVAPPDEAAVSRPLPDIEQPAPPDATAPTPATAGERARVLLAEDHAELRRFMATALAPEAEVLEAADGEAAWQLAERHAPDLIVTDVMMPKVGGEQLLERLQASDATRAIPVLVVSARADEQVRVKLLSQGASDYLTKPFAPQELRVRCRNLIAAGRTRAMLQSELASREEDLTGLARELATRRREAETLAAALRVSRDQAVAALDVRGRFLRLLSHELRAPLTAIQLHLTLLLRSGLGEPQATYLAGADSAIRRLNHLIVSLLEYARIESGRFEVRAAECDLVAVAAEVVAEMRPRAEEKGLAIDFECPAAIEPVVTDRQLVQLVVVNLLDNAVKYTEQGRLAVRLSDQGETRRIEVTDTGPGIAAADIDRLFEPFDQIANVDHKHAPGVGLGLSLAKQLTEALGGRIEVKSEPGRGSTFAVTLPASAEEVCTDDVGTRDRR